MQGIVVKGALMALLWPAVASADLDFEQALAAVAVQAHPVQEARSALSAAEQDAVAAGRLPDPQLGLGINNMPLASSAGVQAYSLGQDPMSSRDISVSQNLRNSASLEAEKAQAQARIGVERARLARALLEARIACADAWLDLWYGQQRLAVFDQQMAENLRLQAVARADLAAAQISPAEALAPALEEQELANARDAEQARLAAARARLERWIGPLATQRLAGSAPAYSDRLPDLEAAIDQHPEVQIQSHQQEVARGELAAAESARHPQWGVNLDYAHRGPAYGDMISLGVSASLPLFSAQRQGPRIQASHEKLLAAGDALEDARQQQRAQLHAAWAEEQSLQRQIQRLQERSLPLLQASIAALLHDYAHATAPAPALTQLLEQRQTLRRLRLQIADLADQRDRLNSELHLSYGRLHTPLSGE